MKKILLFLFVMILTSIKINAIATPTDYVIEFKQSPLGYDRSDVKGTRINSALFQVFSVDFYGEHHVDTFSDSKNIYYSGEDRARFHLIETAQSEGFYENVPLDIFFNLDKTCPHIIVDVKKKVKEYNFSITNKTDNPTYYFVYNSSGDLVTKNLLFGGTNNFIVPYDDYRFKTGYGDLTIHGRPYEYFLRTLVYESDSLSVYSREIEIETPYDLDLTVTKKCIDDEGDFYNVPVDIRKEEDTYGNETYNQSPSEIDIYNVQLEDNDDLSNEITDIEVTKDDDTNLVDEAIIKPESNNESNNSDSVVKDDNSIFDSFIISIKPDSSTNLNSEITKSNDLIKEDKKIKPTHSSSLSKNLKNVNNKEEPIKEEILNEPNIVEELESNLIIEKEDIKKTNSNSKTKVKKASNIPLIIVGLLPLFLIFVVKIIKKVQKI